ncbi:hypothetical protein [Alloactinosynnema sp. L-07]|nr:hypothetical protein [Alloactinosynnema sp. L-07]
MDPVPLEAAMALQILAVVTVAIVFVVRLVIALNDRPTRR